MPPTLEPWFAIATPHEDIREGRLSEAVFAANLWAVKQDNAPEVYLDCEAFFEKTYLTGGLSNVLKAVARALSGDADAGDRILSLQTAFGGGKTHALVALWHLAKHAEAIRKSDACADVRKVLGKGLPKKVNAVAVVTNETCNAVTGRDTPEGVHTWTLWGELALQLGGPKLYEMVEANDKARAVPQGLFGDILREAAPCLILLDELADYCVGASAVEVGDATLADQTISFTQQLTQAVQQVPGVALVATLPASHLEVSSPEKGQEILNRLERRFGRMGADRKPVADDEIYEVIRRRLFETLGDEAKHKKAADAYAKMYQQHRSDVPPEATKGTYRQRILSAYPFHPSLIDALYLRWGSHGDFQRTRGVLRLLASVVGDLWQRRNTETMSQALIQPCHVRWTLDPLHAALTRLWGNAYEAVVAADVTGGKANAPAADEERGGEYTTEKITAGLASAILLGSFGGQGERTGYSTKELRACIGRPGLNWGYTDGALVAMEERGFFLHTGGAGSLGKRYWFGTKPTLVKLISMYKAQYASQDFSAEIVEALEQRTKKLDTGPATWRVLVNPGTDLPEQRSLVLLIMPPECVYAENGGPRLFGSPIEQRLMDLSLQCGKKDRRFRNTLLFLLPSQRGLSRLRGALRDLSALEAVQRDYGDQLDDEQRRELSTRLEKAESSVAEGLGVAYTHVARVEGQEVVFTQLSDAKPDFADHLVAVWEHVVTEEEWVLRKVGQVTLKEVGLVPEEGGSRIKDAIDSFLRFTDKPMVASRDAVVLGLREACRDKLIGIGRGVNVTSLQKKWCGQDVALDPTEEGLWIIPPFEPEAEEAETATATAGAGSQTTTTGAGQADAGSAEGADEDTTTTGRQVRRVTITGNVPAESWSDIFSCFVIPATRMNLKHVRLGVKFELETHDDRPLDVNDPTLKSMEESARQLGLDIEGQP